MKNKNRFTLRLPDEQFNFLKELAEKEDRSISGAIRRIINEFQANQICTVAQNNGVQQSISRPKRTNT